MSLVKYGTFLKRKAPRAVGAFYLQEYYAAP